MDSIETFCWWCAILLILKASQQVAKALFDEKVQPTTLVPKQVGNMYTASLYAAFASLIHNKHSTLVNVLTTIYDKYSSFTTMIPAS